MNLKTIIFMGKSACGKGTQVEKLMEFINKVDEKRRLCFHLESGNRFRSFIQENNYSSLLARKISEEGGLQPEFLAIWAWSGEAISNMEKHTHLLIDGTPRRILEAQVLESALDFYGRNDVEIVYVNVSDEWAANRMHERGRSDDKKDHDIQARLNWFKMNVSPILDYYRKHKSYKFNEINGEQSVEQVHQDILRALDLEKELDIL